MLIRDLKRLAFVVLPLFGLLLIIFTLWTGRPAYSTLHSKINTLIGKPPTGKITSTSHHRIFSLTTPDRKYFPITFGNYTAFNPNIIPHPTRNDTYFIVAQKRRVNPDGTDPVDTSAFNVELGCTAQFLPTTLDDDIATTTLECIDHPDPLPIAATQGDKCTGDLAYMGWNIGPHDARVFYGPESPYIVFGSNSAYACFGMFVQDFRVLVDWSAGATGMGVSMFSGRDAFRMATELQRPGGYGVVEKNWFLFWDGEGRMYAHYEVVPRRVFARVARDGTAGKDLGRVVAEGDGRCLERFLPRVPRGVPEDVHQATNSLRVTLCERGVEGEGEGGDCDRGKETVVIITIVHHKTYYDYHGEYEPYVVAFRERSPFELYGISRKPLWIHGRKKQSEERSDMFYVASMNWKERGRKYHGYLDDVVFLSFGIEDRRSGGIDVRVGDLIAGLGLCSE